jgi:hypothetical protein
MTFGTAMTVRPLAAMVALGGALLLALSCASVNWTGRPIAEVIAELGRPSAVQTLADGRKVYMWSTTRYVAVPPVLGADGQVLQPPDTIDYQSRKVFIVDPDGIVLSWRQVEQRPPLPPTPRR